MSNRLFSLDEVPEIPLRPPLRRRKGAQIMDARLDNDYPPEWDKCTTCEGRGKVWGETHSTTTPIEPGEVMLVWTAPSVDRIVKVPVEAEPRRPGAYVREDDLGVLVGFRRLDEMCPDCLGMGSVKAMVRMFAGHRCLRCQHPFITKGDAKMLGVEPTPGHWSPCDEKCTHTGTIRVWLPEVEAWAMPGDEIGPETYRNHGRVEAEWRVLTTHHLDGDKANLAWWNLVALCQRCHLQIQGKVVMERVYPHEHSEWFRPYAAGYYAYVYLCRVCGRPREDGHHHGRGEVGDGVLPHNFYPGLELTREETLARLDELLALERAA